MQFLYVLERLRHPVLDAIFSAVTYGGDELAFLVLSFALFWCVSKRGGYYAFLVGLFGTLGNQFLKLVCRIPRPWVLDPDFTIVESARAAATGYSFPSGHTQNAVGTFGAMAVTAKRRWVRWVCAALMVLVPFSRMYLGVHTPLDVGVAFALALVLRLPPHRPRAGDRQGPALCPRRGRHRAGHGQVRLGPVRDGSGGQGLHSRQLHCRAAPPGGALRASLPPAGRATAAPERRGQHRRHAAAQPPRQGRLHLHHIGSGSYSFSLRVE